MACFPGKKTPRVSWDRGRVSCDRLAIIVYCHGNYCFKLHMNYSADKNNPRVFPRNEIGRIHCYIS